MKRKTFFASLLIFAFTLSTLFPPALPIFAEPMESVNEQTIASFADEGLEDTGTSESANVEFTGVQEKETEPEPVTDSSGSTVAEQTTAGADVTEQGSEQTTSGVKETELKQTEGELERTEAEMDESENDPEQDLTGNAHSTTVNSTTADAYPVQASEFSYRTVNYGNVAPFLDPVIGPANRRSRMSIGAHSDEPDDGLVLEKRASWIDKDTISIELEAYATGETIITEIKEDVPTDIVLVLDQSGSMSDAFGGYVFSAYTGNDRRNSNHYNRRHNGGTGNLWHHLGDGSYVSVSAIREQSTPYIQMGAGTTNAGTFGNSGYWGESNNLYRLSGGVYHKVTVTRTGSVGNRVYTYTSADGWSYTSTGSNTVPGNDPADLSFPLYRSGTTTYTYTYFYTDSEGNSVQIGEPSVGPNINFPTTFYSRSFSSSAGEAKLAVLKNALNNFVSSVNAKASGADGVLGTADDVDHRIAVVGFASGDRWNYTNYNYENTEVFIGSDQYTYGTAAQSQYGNAFQSMTSQVGRNNVSASIGALDAKGGTLIDLGMEMANGILGHADNAVQPGEKRNRVVIVFTDGEPGWSGYDSSTADLGIAQANVTKNTYGASVYSIGIFSGADASSPGNSNGTNTEKANWFMQNLSSNNGTVQNPSFYLSAGDAETLNNIFQQIADQIEQGSSSVDLGVESVIKDFIAPQFKLPDGMTPDDITIETWKYVGTDPGAAGAWEKNSDSMGATATVNSADGGISVTGFDFAEHFVSAVTDENGTPTGDYRGHKLLIRFDIKVRDGFLGGNGVITNGNASGVYESSDGDLVEAFELPTVDVPIGPIVIKILDKDFGSYYGQPIDQDDLKLTAEVTIGGIGLYFDEPNFGLEDWQNAYVDIQVTPLPDGDVDLDWVTTDFDYKLEVTVTPNKTGTISSEGETGTGTGSIKVFKPKLTFEDSDVWYGDIATYGSDNLDGKTWVHGTLDHKDTNLERLNDEPTLTLVYTPDPTKLSDGKVNTKQDIPVKVDVYIPFGVEPTSQNINEHTTFEHKPCDSSCDWETPAMPGDPAFLLHVKTASLTITKTGGESDEPYVFTIKKDGDGAPYTYTMATIVGNGSVTITELPVGTYTIEEDLAWSWRYSADVVPEQGVTLTKLSPQGEIECRNTKIKEYWLNKYSSVEKNQQGISK